ncbi:MAG: hypothetical protein M3O46_15450, partial [Myxococcota bacterium]|nr:hypothetical protein [Myxococcota bacterium]
MTAPKQIDEVGSSGDETRAPHREPRSMPGRNAEPRFADAPMRRLFQTHYPSIWRLLRRLGIPSDGLDDAAQEVFW